MLLSRKQLQLHQEQEVLIPAALLANVGNSTITFQNISNTVTNCQATLTNIISTIIVKPILDVQTSQVSIANTCLGSNVVVVFTNSKFARWNLPVWLCHYAGNPTSGSHGNVTISGGNGQFTIPSTLFTTAGNHSVTITGIFLQANVLIQTNRLFSIL